MWGKIILDSTTQTNGMKAVIWLSLPSRVESRLSAHGQFVWNLKGVGANTRFFINMSSKICWFFIQTEGKIQCAVTDKRRPSIEKGGLEVPCELMFSLSETVDNGETRNYLPNSVLTNSVIITW